MKKYRLFFRIASFLLILALLLPLAVACSEPLEENQIEVEWHMGMVASDLHLTSPLTLLDGEEQYSYTDLITLEKAGTKVTFTDLLGGEDVIDDKYAEAEAFVVSHWEEKDGAWVISDPGDNYTGTAGRSDEIAVINRGESVTYTYISSFDNEVIRLCYRSGQTKKNTRKIDFAKVYVEETTFQGTLMTSEDSTARSDVLAKRFLATAKETSWYEELKGLTMYAMGDSYLQGSTNGADYVWANLMAKKYDMTYGNWAKGGTTIADSGRSSDMYKRISQMDGGSPDIVLLEGGRNDYNQNIPIGEIDSTNPSTFYGGIYSCITQLRERYPNALIIGITCWAYDSAKKNEAGHVQNDYGNAMLAWCAANGIPCFNAMDKDVVGVDMDDKTWRATYSQTATDVSHLNTFGMILVEPAFEKFIAEQYKAFIAQ